MKALCKVLSLAVFMVMVSGQYALAHDFWINTHNEAPGQNLVIEIGYGHGFPNTEPIPEARTKLFDPPVLIGKDGPVPVKKGDRTNYDFVSEKPVESGTYIAADSYKPTFWSKDKDGKWDMKNKKEMANVELCERSTRFAKKIVNVGGVNDYSVTTPLGHDLEIVPLNANTAQAKVGEYFAFQVLFKGKPQKGVKISGLPANFHHHEEAKAFTIVTDKDGKFDFKPLKGGLWLLKAIHDPAFDDLSVCDLDYFDAFLAFEVSEK
ncbi:DUF4198 domain-containing protein [Deltaproteobacteria bacterium OttesenSCG-928-K17]|nr:DUF4198 domain-containing protein [Deltaproteobacteria bacterium OttesenSCG-928-K17]